MRDGLQVFLCPTPNLHGTLQVAQSSRLAEGLLPLTLLIKKQLKQRFTCVCAQPTCKHQGWEKGFTPLAALSDRLPGSAVRVQGTLCFSQQISEAARPHRNLTYKTEEDNALRAQGTICQYPSCTSEHALWIYGFWFEVLQLNQEKAKQSA